MVKKSFSSSILLAAALSLHPLCFSVPEATEIVTYIDIHADYKVFLNGQDPLTIEDFSGEKSRRDVVEVILIQQALHLGGYGRPIKLRREKFYNRVITLLKLGEAATGASTIWNIDADNTLFYISEPIIRKGEFVAGLYTNQEKAKNFIPTTENILSLKAVSNELWQVDWLALKALGIDKLYSSSEWPSMVRMVWFGRVDVTLAPFQSNKDMSITIDEMTLLPLDGIKVALPGTRHWLVSKVHPHGKELFAALSKGIKVLRSRGTIEKAYSESGFFDRRVKSWQLISP